MAAVTGGADTGGFVVTGSSVFAGFAEGTGVSTTDVSSVGENDGMRIGRGVVGGDDMGTRAGIAIKSTGIEVGNSISGCLDGAGAGTIDAGV